MTRKAWILLSKSIVLDYGSKKRRSLTDAGGTSVREGSPTLTHSSLGVRGGGGKVRGRESGMICMSGMRLHMRAVVHGQTCPLSGDKPFSFAYDDDI